jgi:hypothetical protein
MPAAAASRVSVVNRVAPSVADSSVPESAHHPYRATMIGTQQEVKQMLKRRVA